jgi:short-subunit dehydrogenase
MATNRDEFRRRYGPVALVLGGSEGIGAQFAEQLAALGLDLVLLARRAAPLEALASRISASHGTRVHICVRDLTTADPQQCARQLTGEHQIGLVVCNAGATHGVGTFLDGPLERATGLVRLNCLAPMSFAHEALVAMRRRGRGGLIVVGSMAGLSGSGLIATYAAAKAFQIAWCEGLHWELRSEGIDVMCAIAGLTDTPAMRNSGLSFSAAAASGFRPLDAADVARGALENLGRGALWYAVGAEAAAAMRATPREQLTVTMTGATAALYGVKP